MKVRNGFVANSSSASFIVTWLIDEREKDLSVEDALKILFEYDYREDELIKKLAKYTISLEDNHFKTSFHTIMMNCPGDFGPEADALIFDLHFYNTERSNYIKLVDTVIINEG